MKRLIPVVLSAGVVALILATTGGASNTHGAARAARASAPAPAIGVRSTPLGRILVDAAGRTLYLFEADTADMSNCSGACRSLWPPLAAGRKPAARGGAVAAEIGMTAGGGRPQVTYHGHPLYRYASDAKPGDTAGQGLNQFGGEWYVLAPDGNKIDNG